MPSNELGAADVAEWAVAGGQDGAIGFRDCEPGDAATIADHRRTDPRRLLQIIRGALDWIVMKALEKDRNRRYETPNSLARDIERYLHDQPVQACPPSASYRLKKFVRRNKVAAAFIVLLIASVAGLAISNIAQKRERDAKAAALTRAKAFSGLLQETVGSVSPGLDRETDYTVRQLMVYDDVRIAYFFCHYPQAGRGRRICPQGRSRRKAPHGSLRLDQLALL